MVEYMAMVKNPYSGKFIAVEGIDGSGKTTLAEELFVFLSKHSRQNDSVELVGKVLLTKEPTDKNLGKNEDLKPAERQMLMIEDRKDHLADLIIPALEKGKLVISDRYALSTFAYGMAENIYFENMKDWHEKIIGKNFVWPDLTIFVDAPVEIAYSRLVKRDEKGHFEKMETLKKIRHFYFALSLMSKELPSIYTIDGTKTKEKVFDQAIKLIKRRLKLKI